MWASNSRLEENRYSEMTSIFPRVCHQVKKWMDVSKGGLEQWAAVGGSVLMEAGRGWMWHLTTAIH